VCDTFDRLESLAEYEAECDKECTGYLIERTHYYAAEQRFETPFWQRRHGSPRRHAGRTRAAVKTVKTAPS
jgi:hypothetical protein